MFPFKEKEEAFCKLLIHKACGVPPAASLESGNVALAETTEIVSVMDLQGEEKMVA